MPVLLIEKGPDRGKSFRLAGPELIIGRGNKNVAKLSETGISREHFRVYEKDDNFYIEDLQSLNGTQVNGQMITQALLLNDGDQITIGETCLTWLEKEQAVEKDPLLNQQVAGYHIIERLGRGGMGTVYRARQLSLQRDVAFKMLNPKLSQDNTFIKRFIEEARASATLNHQNILQVFDVGEDNGHYFFSMEYAAKGTIQKLIDGQKHLPIEQAVPYLIQTACGLEYAERKKIVHRDIKPDNLMLSEDNVVKIGDLGLAKRLNQRGVGVKEEKEQIFGTPHFIAPEQAQGEPLDHRADIYACGGTFYRILSGRTPFQGENIRALVMKHIMEEPPSLKSVAPFVPDELCAIITKMMQKNPAKRYSSSTEIIEALTNLGNNSPQEAPVKERKQKTAAMASTKALSRTGAIRREQVATRRTVAKKEATAKKESAPKAHENHSQSNWLFYVLPTVTVIALLLIMFMASPGSKPKNNDTTRPIPYRPTDPIANKDPVKPPKEVPVKPTIQSDSEVRAERLYKQAKEVIKNGGKPQEAIQKYVRIVQEFSQSKCAQKAKEDIEQLETLMSQRLKESDKTIKELLQQQKIAQALEHLSKIYDEIKGVELLEQEVKIITQDVEEKLLREVGIMQASFRKNLQSGQFKDATKKIGTLQEWEKAADGELRTMLSKEVTEWQEELGKIKQANNNEKQFVTQYKKILETSLQNYQFQKGANELTALSGKFYSEDYKDELKKAIDDLPKLEQLLEQVNKKIAANEQPVMQHILREGIPRLPSLVDNAEIKLVGIKDGNLLLQIALPQAGGSIDKSVPLSQLSPAWFYDNLMQNATNAPDQKMLLNMVIYCYYYKLYAQAWDGCQKLAKANVDNADLQELKKDLDSVETTAQTAYDALAKKYRELYKKFQTAPLGDKKLLQKEILQLQKELETYQKEYEFSRFFNQVNKVNKSEK